MVIAKKLHCGHLFHVHCLRSWLERQNNCPTCRALVIPSENGSAGSGQESRTTVASMSIQASEDTHLSLDEARLKAAALAASMYVKSFVYSPSSTYLRSPGFSCTNHGNILETNNALKPGSSESIEGSSSSGLPKQHQPSGSSVSMLKARATFIETQIEILGNKLLALQKQDETKSKVSGGDADRAVSDVDVKGKAVVDT